MHRHTQTAVTLLLPFAFLVAGCGGGAGNEPVGEDDSITSSSSAISSGVSVGEKLRTTADLNLRTGPSTAHSIITVIPKGDEVTVESATHSNGFYHVKFGSHTGWSSGLYLKTVGGSSSSAAVNRAMEWVHADMPYCGGINHGHDYICGGTCERRGAADEAAWNPYRSDCSGLVSFAWDLPHPGRITSEFAPYNGGVSYLINADDLEPGDALNSDPDEHIILFAGWEDRAAGRAHIIEEYNCGHDATYHVLHLETSGTWVYISDWEPHHYRSIRHR